MKRCFFIVILMTIALSCNSQNTSANRVIPVGAIAETETHIWKLDTIWTNSQSTYVTWTVIRKEANFQLNLKNTYKLVDCNSGTSYNANFVCKSDPRLFSSYIEEDVSMFFPSLPESTSEISINFSPTFYVDSIQTYLNSHFMLECRYSVPIWGEEAITKLKDSINYSNRLFESGVNCYKRKDYRDAVIAFEKQMAFDRLLFGTDEYQSRRITCVKGWLSHCYFLLGNIERAKRIYSDFLFEPYDMRLTKEADSLYQVSRSKNLDYDIQSFKRICYLDSVALGKNSCRYIESLMELGEEYTEASDYTNATHVLTNAAQILKSIGGDNSLLYYQILYSLAEVAAVDNNSTIPASQYMEKALAVENDLVRNDIERDEGVLAPMRTLSDYYAQERQWTKAIDIKKRRLEHILGSESSEVSKANADIIFDDLMFWIENGDDVKYALRRIMELEIKNGNRYDLWLGNCYYYLKDYDKALFYYEKSKYDYGKVRVLAAKGLTKEALALQRKVVIDEEERRKHTIYISHDLYPRYLSTLASLYIINEQYDSAIACERQNVVSVSSLLNLGRAYAGKKQWDVAMGYAMDAYKMHWQTKTHLEVLSDLLSFSFQARNGNLQHFVSDFIKNTRKELSSTFQELTYNERSRYIEHYSGLLSNQIPMYAYYVPSDTLNALAYDASLLIKGALLNSENSVRRIINESEDTSLKDLWEELRADRYILNKELEKDSLGRRINIDSLQNVIYNLEDLLVVKCKEYDDITKSMRLKWHDIQKHLSPTDIAVEFLRIPISNDSVVYVALTLQSDSEMPKMTALFEEKQLKQVPDTLYYQCEEIADLVWKPLRSELQGVKNIYFSPSGALYNIGIEYLPGMEEYNIYRLSSTRELATRKENETGTRAVIYGGLDYYADLDTLSGNKSQAILSATFMEHADVRSLKLRGGKGRLKHTMDEVKQIGATFSESNWICLLDTASLGTEESFKSLAGKKVNAVHIATHGFYYTPEEADNTKYDFFLLDNQDLSAEDKSLTRSGLIMSGANHILEGEKMPDNVEDGILTAKEIADVDLRGLDLVVLSACQTGLGDISQGEGVFGLQRGFKKAGANSILMSLWEVNDKATQILMTQFYKNWLSGQSKRQSLLSAQKYLRETEDGNYNEPKYWAAFILLDGLN